MGSNSRVWYISLAEEVSKSDVIERAYTPSSSFGGIDESPYRQCSTESGCVLVDDASFLKVSNVIHDQVGKKTCYAFTIATTVRCAQRMDGSIPEETIDLVKWITGKPKYGNVVQGGKLFEYFEDFTAKYLHWHFLPFPIYEPRTLASILYRNGDRTFYTNLLKYFQKHLHEEGLIQMITFHLTMEEWNAFQNFHSYELPATEQVIRQLRQIKQKLAARRFTLNDQDKKLLNHIYWNIDKVPTEIEEKYTSIAQEYPQITVLISEQSTNNSFLVTPSSVPINTNIVFDPKKQYFVDSVSKVQINDARLSGHSCVVMSYDSTGIMLKNSWGEKWGFIGGVFHVSQAWMNELYKIHRVVLFTLHKRWERSRWVTTSGKLT